MSKQTILWADDDEDDLMMMREILEQADQSFEIIEVYNGKEAVNYLQQRKQNKEGFPCLIILDINMPVMNGKEALAHIKNDEDLKTIPVVVFTTSKSSMDQLFCQHYGVTMISKPPDFETLRTQVKKLVTYCRQ